MNYANQAAALKSYSLKYDETNNIIKKNNDAFQYDLLNQLLYANLKGNFEIDQEEETQKIGKTSDFKGQKTFEFELNQLEVIELDYAAGSIGVDLLAPVKVTKIELQPNSPIHRVTKSTSIRVYISQDNITYTRLKDWKMVAKEKGKVEIVLNNPVTARYIKVKSMFDERDSELNPVNQAQFVNVPQDLIHVYYMMSMRQEEYSYDKIGNRLTETVTQRYPIARTYFYYENSSRLKSNGKYIFEYDANGNLVKKETLIGEKITWKYEYDLFNRLVKVTKNDGVVAEYLYDEAGLRIKKQGTNSAIYYTFDTGGNVLYEQENREYMEYIYVLGKHFARIDGNLDKLEEKTKYFYHTDHLGSTVLVTDEAGQQVWSAEYTPFGKQVSKDGELDHVTKFTGKDLDEDTGLYYFNARWYDQEVGRFISEDPAQDGINWYIYCNNRPLTFHDPDGKKPVESIDEVKHFGLGFAKGVWGFVKSVGQTATQVGKLVTDPKYRTQVGNQIATTTKNIVKKVEQYKQAIQGNPSAIGATISDTVNVSVAATEKYTEYQSMSPNEQAEAGGYLAGRLSGELAGAYLGAKGLDKLKNLSTVSKLTTASEVLDTTTDMSKISKAVDTIQDASNVGRVRPDFYVTPNGEAIPGIGFRYGYGEIPSSNLIEPSSQGIRYFSFNKYDTAFDAKNGLQLLDPPTYRASFDTLQVTDNLRIPFSNWNTGNTLEPLTFSYPEFGTGGGTQAITSQNIFADGFTLLP